MQVIQEKLRAAFAAYAENISVEYNDRYINYHALEAGAGKYADFLARQDIKPGSFIGIYVRDKQAFIELVLAVLHHGAVFVPIDPQLPAARIDTLLSIVEPSFVFTDIILPADAKPLHEKIFYISDIPASTAKDRSLFTGVYTADDAVYVFFTSGSTGQPKAVLGKNESLTHFIEWETKECLVDATARFSQFAAPGFDAILRDIFVPLASGATICIPEGRDFIYYPDRLAEWIDASRITHIHCVPSVFRIINGLSLSSQHFSSLGYIIMAGEEIKSNELKTWYNTFGDRIQLINLYGATEVTMAKTCYRIQPADVHRARIPAGFAISNTQIIVMDEDFERCDDYVIGEIFIRTPFITLGYYRDDSLNAVKFIPNPYSADPNDLIYRTGDLGRLLTDGNLEFLGRKDNLLKIRGNRVDPAEIENYILNHPQVTNCVVTAKVAAGGELELCCYFTGEPLDLHQLRNYAAMGLPSSMVPSYFMQLAEIPLGVNGKVDKDALPEPQLIVEEYIPARNAVDEKLAAIWSQVLNIEKEKISIQSRFFDLGGNSLKLMALVSGIHKDLNIRMPLGELFSRPTIEGISDYLQQQTESSFSHIEKAAEAETYRLSSAQQRIFFVAQLGNSGTAYNMPGKISFDHTPDKEKIEHALQQLLARHESLRTSFELDNGVAVQRIHSSVDFSLDKVVVTPQELTSFITKEFIRPFDLGQAPLLRAVLVETADRSTLYYDMHHIICDGSSLQILENDLQQLIAGKQPAPLRLQYKDFAEWQHTAKQRSEMLLQEKFWVNEMHGDLPVLTLPFDYNRSMGLSAENSRILLKVNRSVYFLLRGYCNEVKVTPSMLLLAILKLILFRMSRQTDFIVGMPVEGRQHTDTQQMVGMFINFLPVRTYPQADKTFAEYLNELKQQLTAAFDNSDYQFDDLVQHLTKEKRIADYQNPVFNVTFNYISQLSNSIFIDRHNPEDDLGLLKRGAKSALQVGCVDIGDELVINFEYNSGLFKADTIKQIKNYFESLITRVPSLSGRQLGDIELELPQAMNVALNERDIHIGLPFPTIQDLIQNSFAHYADKTAIEHDGQSITYKELDQRSTAIAHQVMAPAGSHIGLYFTNKAEFVIAFLGILKAGCVAVPLDTKLPAQRIIQMAIKTDLEWVLTDETTGERLFDFIKIIPATSQQDDTIIRKTPIASYSPDDRAYIFFTSGTTGLPKAIVGRNESLCHFIHCEQQFLHAPEGLRVSQLVNHGFDAILRDIFLPLSLGGVICIPSSGELLLDALALTEWLRSARINVMHCVPSIFKAISNELTVAGELPDMQAIVMAGEELKPNELRSWYEQMGDRIQLVNMYGTTETTMAKTCHFIQRNEMQSDKVLSGISLPGSQVVILDGQLKLQPALIPGDIYIRTPYRTHGYYNDAALNEQRFVINPYTGDSNDLLYHTGDTGYIVAAGELKLLGRSDKQVKIRGNRVEPGEIENYLLRHAGIREAVVIARADEAGDLYLCCYYVTDTALAATAVKTYMSEGLPAFMVPDYIMELEAIPLLANGKIDYHALPVVQLMADVITAPRDEVEEQMATLWQQVLNREAGTIDIYSRFFDTGGNSLKLISLISRIHKAFDVRLPLADIFKQATIEGMSELVRHQQKELFYSIGQAAEKSSYRLSSAQRRIYFIHHLDTQSTAYNMPGRISLPGAMTREQVERLMRQLFMRHESFRTSFVMEENEVMQRIATDLLFVLEEKQVAGDKEAEAISDFVQPFDLSVAPLFRAMLVRRGTELTLYYDIHHIISDGSSAQLLEKEFTSLLSGITLPAVRLQYRDFSEWQNSEEVGVEINKQAAYWKQVLSGDLPVLQLPSSYARSKWSGYNEERVELLLPIATVNRLRQLATRNGLSLSMVLLGAFELLLSKVCGQEDIIVGMPVEGRPHIDTYEIIGMFVNFLSVRGYPSADKEVGTFFSEIKQASLGAQSNSLYPFDELVQQVKISRDPTRNPVFDVVFNFLSQFSELSPEAGRGSSWELLRHGAKVDLLLNCSEVGEGVYISFNYNRDLFTASVMESMRDLLGYLLAQLEGNWHHRIGELELLLPQQRSLVEAQLQDSLEQVLPYTTIQAMLEQSCKAYSDRTAMEWRGRSYRYEEIAACSEAVAVLLQQNQVAKGSVVGIYTTNKVDFIIGMLGVMKAGAIVMPVDPQLPAERVRVLVSVTKMSVVLTGEQSPVEEAGLEEVALQLSIGEKLYQQQQQQPTKLISVSYTSEDALYIFFTSGSTGVPKAIVGRNESLCHFIEWEVNCFGLTGADRVSQLTSPGFDAILRDIFVPLSVGGVICIPDSREQLFDPGQLVEWIGSSRVSVVHCVPGIFRLLRSERPSRSAFAALRYIAMAGEELKPNELRSWYEQMGDRIQLVNMYGATETTMAKTFYFIQEADINNARLPVGRAMNGSQFITFNGLKALPALVPGDIYIRTPYRTHGYYNDTVLNEQRFIINPYTGNINDLLYHTGDKGRILPNGNLEFLGRTDKQVKIRGNRVEPGEIENYLLRHAGIREAVVIARADEAGDLYLCCYYVTDTILAATTVKRYMSEGLPTYMVPDHIMALEAMPLLPNGKVDHTALPETGEVEEQMTAPRDEMEQQMAALWQQVLNRETGTIDIRSRFFDTGGNSLKLMSLISRIHKAFDVRLPLGDIFKQATIEGMSELVRHRQKEVFYSIGPATEKSSYRLSSAQRRIYFIHQLDTQSTAYNMPGRISLPATMTREQIEQVIRALFMRHESFRTSFVLEEGEVMQRIATDLLFVLEEKQITTGDEGQAVIDFVQPFDLSAAPLFRAMLVRSGNELTLYYDIHHIISDGSSGRLLEKEFTSLLSGVELPAVRLQYRDFSEWQNSEEVGVEINKQAAYWKQVLSGDLPVLQLPTSYARTKWSGYNEERVELLLPVATVNKLRQLGTRHGLTLSMVLLGAFELLLSKVSGQEDIIVGMPVEGRPHIDTYEIIGMFVNFLSVRGYPSADKQVGTFFTEIRQSSLDAQSNSLYPFDELVQQVKISRDPTRNPVFDVVFNFLSQFSEGSPAAGKGSSWEILRHGAKVDLLLNCSEVGESVYISFNYNRDLFTASVMESMRDLLGYLLAQLEGNWHHRIGELELLLPGQRSLVEAQLQDSLQQVLPYTTIQAMLEQSCKAYSDRTAIEWRGRSYGYQEIGSCSDAVAVLLQQNQVAKGSVVGIYTTNKVDFIIGMLGIMKAGAIVMPVDPQLPAERVRVLVSVTKMEVVLTGEQEEAAYQQAGLEEVALRLSIGEKLYAQQHAPLAPILYDSEDALYIFFTSGSTGVPKAIVGRNESLCHFIEWEVNCFGLTGADRVSQLTSPGFDAILRDIFVPLSVGGVICIPDSREQLFDPGQLVEWIGSSRVSVVHCVPGIFRLLRSERPSRSAFAALRYIAMAGEELKPNELRSWYEQMGDRIQLVNMYGATETTLIRTYYFIKDADTDKARLPIGRPFAGSQAIILDNNLKLQPALVPGNIYIRTPYRTHGYYNDSLNEGRFIINPYTNQPDDLIYLSGDRGRLLPDGNLEFLGRSDKQVKIRGNRVEPGEIENYLLRHAGIREAVVIARADEAGDLYLCCYYVADTTLNAATVKTYMSEGLPAYMVPDHIVVLEAMPLLPNGKIDHNALPETSEIEEQVIAPRDEMEQQMAALWEQVLNREPGTIDIRSRFFDTGGNSLKLMSLISRIHKAFDVRLPLGEIFKQATIEGMSELVRKRSKSIFVKIKPREKLEYYTLTPAQQRLFFLHQLNPDSTSYNMQLKIDVTGLAEENITRAIHYLLIRHESLRTSFHVIAEQPVQVVRQQVPFQLVRLNEQKEAERFFNAFDLQTAPLFRAGILSVGGKEELHIVIHHIISDAVTERILFQEFNILLAGKYPAPLALQYRDFERWKNSEIHRKEIEEQSLFWQRELEGSLPDLRLPYDLAANNIEEVKAAGVEYFMPDTETCARLSLLLKEKGITLFMYLITVYKTLLFKYTQQNDIIIGFPVAGRNHADLDEVAGFFVNILVIRSYPELCLSFDDYTQWMSKKIKAILTNSDYQFNTLINDVQVKKGEKVPLVKTIFTMQNAYGNEGVHFDEKAFSQMNRPQKNEAQAKFDLFMDAFEYKQRIVFRISYEKQLFSAETISNMKKHMLEIIDQTTSDFTILLGDIKLSTDRIKAGSGMHQFENEEFDFSIL